MRHRQHVDDTNLIVSVEEIIAGVPQTGNAPTYLMRRSADGQFYNAGGPGWGAGAVWNPLLEADAVNQPGVYTDLVLAADVRLADVGDTLMVAYQDGAVVMYEHEQIVVTDSPANSVWDALETAHTVVGSFGELMKVIASLGFRHYRQFNHVYNGNGQLTSCDIRVYATAADMAGFPGADTPLYTFSWTTSYAGSQPDISACT
jgi:hypothetical protein